VITATYDVHNSKLLSTWRTAIEQWLSNFLAEYGRHAIWLVPALAFAEACIGLGLFVSGAFLVIVGTTLLSTENASLTQIMILAFLGATSGDHLGYLIGRWVGPGFHHTKLAGRYRESINRAEQMILRHGVLAIFAGRFIPAIRSIVPGLVGVSGLHPLRYSLSDLLACLLWSAALGAILLGTDAFF